MTSQRFAFVLTGEYPDEIKQLALMLHLSSPKTMDLLRDKLQLPLPTVQTIRSWCRKENFSPGLIDMSLRALAVEAKKYNYPVFAVLAFDEVRLRPAIREIGGVLYGYVDYGTGLIDGADPDNCELATELLVFVVRGINVKVSIPVAFLLINGMDAKFRRNMILELICVLAEHLIRIRSVTCDGLWSNQSAAKALGISFDGLKNGLHGEEECSFPDPAFKGDDPEKAARITYNIDTAHCLKNHRNNLGDTDKALMFLPEMFGDIPIEFKYVRELGQMQLKMRLRLKNKITPKVIDFRKNEMSVALACRVLSRSTAKTLEFHHRQDPNGFFKDVGPMVEFILVIDEVFDLLNSRSPNAPW
jgi:hypothetical protein